jgi:hypothetical protein
VTKEEANQAIDGVFLVLGAPEAIKVGPFMQIDLKSKIVASIAVAVKQHGADAVKQALLAGVDAAIALTTPVTRDSDSVQVP